MVQLRYHLSLERQKNKNKKKRLESKLLHIQMINERIHQPGLGILLYIIVYAVWEKSPLPPIFTFLICHIWYLNSY